MSNIPKEFDPSFIAEQSANEMHMYRDEVGSKEPMASVLKNNPEIYFVTPKSRKDWGNWEFKAGAYYDTTIGSKHDYWRDQDLPQHPGT